MNLKIVFWYPSKLESQVPKEIEFSELVQWIVYLNGMGLNVMIPKDVMTKQTVYVDEKMFTQR